MKYIEIDKDKCTGCGLCASDCVGGCISLGDNDIPKMIFPEHCLSCGHCMSICPSGALSFNGLNPEDSEKINDNLVEPDKLFSLIKSRRSVRQYKDEEISDDLWDKIKSMLPYIPTGCNSHALHFSIVRKREVMQILKDKVNKNILRALSNPVLTPLAKKFAYAKSAFEKGEDIVFRGAPHMIVVSSPISAPCASTDPIIALSYIELYAKSLGLGTCWCGYGQICVKIMPELCEILEIPKGYAPVYTMLIGIPAVNYQRETQPDKYMSSEIKDVIPKDSCLFCKTKRLITNFLR